jgi:hypothetical protein
MSVIVLDTYCITMEKNFANAFCYSVQSVIFPYSSQNTKDKTHTHMHAYIHSLNFLNENNKEISDSVVSGMQLETENIEI